MFWEELEEVLQSVPRHEKLFLGGDFNGHIGERADGYVRTHGGKKQWRGSTFRLRFSI